jgi:hypothetical protein
MVTIWGLAEGRRSTKGCATGALAWRDYATAEEAKAAEADWRVILKVTRKER